MDDDPRPPARWLVARGLLGAVVAVGANLAVLRAGLVVTELPPPYRLDAPWPVVVPLAAAVGATVLYAGLRRRSSRPFAAFVRLASVALVVSFVPIAVAARTYRTEWPAVVVLVAMHVVVATALVAVFSSDSRRERPLDPTAR